MPERDMSRRYNDNGILSPPGHPPLKSKMYCIFKGHNWSKEENSEYAVCDRCGAYIFGGYINIWEE